MRIGVVKERKQLPVLFNFDAVAFNVKCSPVVMKHVGQFARGREVNQITGRSIEESILYNVSRHIVKRDWLWSFAINENVAVHS